MKPEELEILTKIWSMMSTALHEENWNLLVKATIKLSGFIKDSGGFKGNLDIDEPIFNAGVPEGRENGE